MGRHETGGNLDNSGSSLDSATDVHGETHSANPFQSVIENCLGSLREVPDPKVRIKTIEVLNDELERERIRIMSEL